VTPPSSETVVTTLVPDSVFSVVYSSDNGFERVSEHGPSIEITFTFTTHRSDPLLLAYDIQNDVTHHEIEWLEDHHYLFDSILDWLVSANRIASLLALEYSLTIR